jgi:hypothetical protein
MNGQTVLTATIIRELPMNLHGIPTVNYRITVVLTHSTDCTSSAVTASKYLTSNVKFDIHNKSVHLQIYSLSTTKKMSIFSIYLFQ